MFLERKVSCSFINLVRSLQPDISLSSAYRWVSVCGYSYTYMSTWAWLYFGEILQGKANSCKNILSMKNGKLGRVTTEFVVKKINSQII